MKFTIKIITKVILCGALIIGTGCSDFLEEKDPSNIAPATFFQVPGMLRPLFMVFMRT